MLSLVIGGARSGKSRFAQSLVMDQAGRRLDRLPHCAYIATARVEDAEMAGRVARHREDRPETWVTVEEPLEIAGAAERCARDCSFIVLDCLTLWLSNFCWERRECAEREVHDAALGEVAKLATACGGAHLVVVTNEVGCGIVPESAVGRSFRDLHGWVNQEVARSADWVYHVVAGIASPIKKPEVTA